MHQLLKIKLRAKLIIYMIIALAIPLIFINILWYNFVREQILITTTAKLKSTASDIAAHVEEYIHLKHTALLYHSHTAATHKKDLRQMQVDFTHFLEDSPDFREIIVFNTAGTEQFRLRQPDYTPDPGSQVSNPQTANVTDVVRKRREFSLGEVVFANGEPLVDIYLPVIINSENTASGSAKVDFEETHDVAQTGGIWGVIVAKVTFEPLWDYIQEIKIGEKGYVFVINSKGEVLAHPKKEMYLQKKNVLAMKEVNKIVEDMVKYPLGDEEEEPEEEINTAKNEFGVPAVTSHERVKGTEWGVITQNNLDDVLSATAEITKFVIGFLIVVLVLVVSLSIWVAYKIVKPVSQLDTATRAFQKGNLASRADIKTGDEIETLGQSFNVMADTIQSQIEDLKKVDHIKNEFLALVSHNLRTPLVAIEGYTELLKKNANLPESETQDIEKLRTNITILKRMINEIVNISTLNASGISLRKQPVQITELVQTIVSDLASESAAKQVEMTVNADDGISEIALDKNKMRDTLANIIENAIKFSREHSIVDIQIQKRETNIIVSVKDAGIGIDPVVMPELFTMFHRGTDYLNYNYQGIGLGLYYAKLVIEHHGGKLNLVSEKDKGTTVTITLPVAA